MTLFWLVVGSILVHSALYVFLLRSQEKNALMYRWFERVFERIAKTLFGWIDREG
ncbi:hypothetical protein BH789_gp094 [Gordonia phage GMA6]|uniref:Uncharacterized protein n=1 Tax=Gordonia phage GMA6 TaxID=1647285 RepID=A0A0K0NKW4_9CAUD|nr:hypothetical protein BH789_gp094 [Gordonia phage GMA6]AKL88375.1 hypothetical protein GMA6_94 [Gordonia phage GMA6]